MYAHAITHPHACAPSHARVCIQWHARKYVRAPRIHNLAHTHTRPPPPSDTHMPPSHALAYTHEYAHVLAYTYAYIRSHARTYIHARVLRPYTHLRPHVPSLTLHPHIEYYILCIYIYLQNYAYHFIVKGLQTYYT